MQTLRSKITGYRVFRVRKEGDEIILNSLYSGFRWHKENKKALCRKETHSAPANNCRCGYNYYHSYDKALQEKNLQDFLHPGNVHLIGAVAGHGDIEAYYYGIRSEYCDLVCLIESKDNSSQNLIKIYEENEDNLFSKMSILDLKTRHLNQLILKQNILRNKDIPLLSLNEATEYLKNFGREFPDDLKPKKPILCSDCDYYPHYENESCAFCQLIEDNKQAYKINQALNNKLEFIPKQARETDFQYNVEIVAAIIVVLFSVVVGGLLGLLIGIL